jgi:hypothetical protein
VPHIFSWVSSTFISILLKQTAKEEHHLEEELFQNPDKLIQVVVVELLFMQNRQP